MCPSSGSAWAVSTRGCELLGPGPMRIRVGTCGRSMPYITAWNFADRRVAGVVHAGVVAVRRGEGGEDRDALLLLPGKPQRRCRGWITSDS